MVNTFSALRWNGKLICKCNIIIMPFLPVYLSQYIFIATFCFTNKHATVPKTKPNKAVNFIRTNWLVQPVPTDQGHAVIRAVALFILCWRPRRTVIRPVALFWCHWLGSIKATWATLIIDSRHNECSREDCAEYWTRVKTVPNIERSQKKIQIVNWRGWYEIRKCHFALLRCEINLKL